MFLIEGELSMATNSHVAIVGAGMVGLVLANQLADADIPVVLFERQLPDSDFDPVPVTPQGQPVRVSAINQHSVQLLKKIHVWQALNPVCVGPFRSIEAWVQGGHDQLQFSAAELGHQFLGAMVQNREIVRVLWARAQQHAQIQLECPSVLDSLSSLKQRFALVVGADGGQSWVRRQADITCHERSYGQQAIVATIHTTKPHEQIAYQHFMRSGPLGVLPLSDKNTVSIVWSAEFDEAQRLMSLSEDQFNIELSNAMNCRLGMMTLKTQRQCIPLVRRHAATYIQDRVVLVGDAAHTIHPLAGQGVNLGFKDADVLARCLIAAKQCGRLLDDVSALRRYARERRLDNTQMHVAMSTLLTLFCRSSPWFQPVLSSGIQLINQQAALRYFLTRLASL